MPPGAVRLVVTDHESNDPATLAYLRSLDQTAAVMLYRGAFNSSAVNNAAVVRHGEGCETLLFANNDIKTIVHPLQR